eukprot:gnl/MRDRNA2_/MRDRNA2_135348_c0_seq1.p2 gnl/MRDRNA2_/MRDRNA2_135348_c0~~gnl/MRDRNA2_/MRDRNA2_135348_c0_seq1.p2  ORF type:complete len:139 (+),score=8.40 gnl/MRDRNA2_/MRDRNA2_135348_c0_seq1:1464-1880(+)
MLVAKKIGCILLVDDDMTSNFYNKSVIQQLNIAEKVEVAWNGKEAMEFLENPENENPELILLDINMPVMDGFEFVKALDINTTIDKSGIKIVMLTTSQHEKDVDKFKKYGLVSQYISKPIEREHLLSLVSELGKGYFE